MVATLSDRQEPLTVLLVEDNAADIMLMEEVIADYGIDVNLQVVTDGVAAIDYLKQRGEYKRRRFPFARHLWQCTSAAGYN